MRSTTSRASGAAASARPARPGVRIPPPIIYAATFLIGLGAQIFWPLPALARPLALGVGAALTLPAAALIAASVPTMVRRGGTLNTNAASRLLVTSGVFRLTRNPMYLALPLLYAAMACITGVTWALPLVILPILHTRYVVVAREERFLESAFGAEYRQYSARVRRWL